MKITNQIRTIIKDVEKFSKAGNTDCAFWQGYFATQLSVLKRLKLEQYKKREVGDQEVKVKK